MAKSVTETPAGLAVAGFARVVERGLTERGLSMAQYRLLALLSHGSEVASRVADVLLSSRPTVTSLVDGLVTKGYVDRRPDPSDRRKIALSLTDEGTAALAAAHAAADGAVQALLATASPEDAETAAAGLRAWARIFDTARERLLEERREQRG
ncbi:MAG: MarR family transcriptional regulator [Actinobacteria bacterium]|nr:MarR family transcriptional regulator [Actinomycetota bacterium]